MKKSLVMTAVAVALGVQSAPSFAEGADPTTWVQNTSKFGRQVGLCTPLSQWRWLNWLPCVGI